MDEYKNDTKIRHDPANMDPRSAAGGCIIPANSVDQPWGPSYTPGSDCQRGNEDQGSLYQLNTPLSLRPQVSNQPYHRQSHQYPLEQVQNPPHTIPNTSVQGYGTLTPTSGLGNQELIRNHSQPTYGIKSNLNVPSGSQRCNNSNILLSSLLSSQPSAPQRPHGIPSSRPNNVLSSILSSRPVATTASTTPNTNTTSNNSLNGLLSNLTPRIKEEPGTQRNDNSNYNNSLLNSLLLRGTDDERTNILPIKTEPEYQQNVLDEDLSSPYDLISTSANQRSNLTKQTICRNQLTHLTVKNQGLEMKFETQSVPPSGPPHLSSTGEPPHSSQGTGIVVGGAGTDVVSVDSLLLSPWGSQATDFLESPDVKQTGLHDGWDSIILNSSVDVNSQSLAELKPLPPFTGYTGHLSINGIPGHHYHTIASSQRTNILQSSSPTSSTNQEYYESSVVSSSTPCPQGNQKQLPQSTQEEEPAYDMEDIAEIIGSAIADTTVPGGNNNSSDNDQDVSRDWIDIADWIDNACSPKQETNSNYQMYQNQHQPHNPTLQNLLSHSCSPLLHARLQGATGGLQNASCGETPSSTSPYPPVSPPGRVSTSCSPDLIHSSFATPAHPRKRSRPNPGSNNPNKKGPGATTAMPYGTESGLIGGKEKPVHRCTICNRGFLNKSNIKVHLRTHTGEKPFRCDICSKAFRQKAHLIKHQQIHKRINRD